MAQAPAAGLGRDFEFPGFQRRRIDQECKVSKFDTEPFFDGSDETTAEPVEAAEPIAAALFADLVHASPATIPASTLDMIGIEAEVACRLDIAGIAAGYSPRAISSFMISLVPA